MKIKPESEFKKQIESRCTGESVNIPQWVSLLAIMSMIIRSPKSLLFISIPTCIIYLLMPSSAIRVFAMTMNAYIITFTMAVLARERLEDK